MNANNDAEAVLGLIAPVNVKNPLAVVSGYCGIFSLLCFGPVLGIPAMITGFLALKKPELGGKGRAYTGIVTGGLSTLVYTGLILVLVVAK